MNRLSTQKSGRQRPAGFCLIEAILGGMLMVTMVLFLIDMMAVIAAHTTQDRVTYNAARMAANSDQSSARQAAEKMVALAQRQKSLIKKVSLSDFTYVKDHRVEVTLLSQMLLPAALPGLPNTITFKTTAIAPVVSSPSIRF